MPAHANTYTEQHTRQRGWNLSRSLVKGMLAHADMKQSSTRVEAHATSPVSPMCKTEPVERHASACRQTALERKYCVERGSLSSKRGHKSTTQRTSNGHPRADDTIWWAVKVEHAGVETDTARVTGFAPTTCMESPKALHMTQDETYTTTGHARADCMHVRMHTHTHRERERERESVTHRAQVASRS